MDHRKPLSTNSPNQPRPELPDTATRIPGYLAGNAKRIKTAEVDTGNERRRRLMWWLKWAFLLPLGAYVLVWLLVIFIDVFNY